MTWHPTTSTWGMKNKPMIPTRGPWDFDYRGALSGQILDIRDNEGPHKKRLYIIYRYNGDSWKVWDTRELRKAMDRACVDVGDKVKISRLNKISEHNGIAEYE